MIENAWKYEIYNRDDSETPSPFVSFSPIIIILFYNSRKWKTNNIFFSFPPPLSFSYEHTKLLSIAHFIILSIIFHISHARYLSINLQPSFFRFSSLLQPLLRKMRGKKYFFLSALLSINKLIIFQSLSLSLFLLSFDI